MHNKHQGYIFFYAARHWVSKHRAGCKSGRNFPQQKRVRCNTELFLKSINKIITQPFEGVTKGHIPHI